MLSFSTKLIASLPVAAATLAVTFAPAALAQRPDPRQVYVNSIAFAGSGCPAGTVAGSVSADAAAFNLVFDSFIAEAGPGVPFSESRKTCMINLDLHVPSGWSYAVSSVETRGYAALQGGTSATQTLRYYFAGSATSGALQGTITGPRDSGYVLRDQVGLASQVWSPCNVSRSLNINLAVRVQASGGRHGLVTVDEIDGGYSNHYFLSFRRC